MVLAPPFALGVDSVQVEITLAAPAAAGKGLKAACQVIEKDDRGGISVGSRRRQYKQLWWDAAKVCDKTLKHCELRSV